MDRQNPQEGLTLSHFVFRPRHKVHAVTERARGYTLSALCRFLGKSTDSVIPVKSAWLEDSVINSTMRVW